MLLLVTERLVFAPASRRSVVPTERLTTPVLSRTAPFAPAVKVTVLWAVCSTRPARVCVLNWVSRPRIVTGVAFKVSVPAADKMLSIGAKA